jgi:hypothetical protein
VRPPKEIRLGELVLSGLSDEHATRIKTWSTAGRGTGTCTASSGNPSRLLV